MAKLNREEYVEQAFLFKGLAERLRRGEATQDLLSNIREEILVTTNLPIAIDYLRTELNHSGQMSKAMKRLSHYFSPFQSFVVAVSEDDRARLDLKTAFRILHAEAQLRVADPTPQTLFFFQLETLCRNRMDYDHGIDAISKDPFYSQPWPEWLQLVRRQMGLIEIMDLVYVASECYVDNLKRVEFNPESQPKIVLFGRKEGKIALANRKKEPSYFFEALQRQLGYPPVPKIEKVVEEPIELLNKILTRVDKLETRIKMLEDESRSGSIDLTKFYGKKVSDGE